VYEVDVLAIGDSLRSGDAIMLRFTRADGSLAHVIVDAGFQSNGDNIVEHFKNAYGTDFVDIAFLTHPDGDHIGGMGQVVRDLRVGVLALQRPLLHGGGPLRASSAVEDLVTVAEEQGTTAVEVFEGASAFDGMLRVAGPTTDYYEELIAEQVAVEVAGSAARQGVALASRAAAVSMLQRAAAAVLPRLPIEIPFGDAGGDNARNNSSTIIDIRFAPDRRLLLTADAGVPAINRALDALDAAGRNDRPPDIVQVPHHGSRHNCDSPTLTRLLGAPGQETHRTGFISISREASEDPRYPSPRVANAHARRGCSVITTAGENLLMCWGVPLRQGYVRATPLPPLDESIDDRP
jgi:beta-lactamase superfamily II metal-dependent hydrolase